PRGRSRSQRLREPLRLRRRLRRPPRAPPSGAVSPLTSTSFVSWGGPSKPYPQRARGYIGDVSTNVQRTHLRVDARGLLVESPAFAEAVEGRVVQTELGDAPHRFILVDDE